MIHVFEKFDALLDSKIKARMKNQNLARVLKFLIKLNIFAIPLYAIILSGIRWTFLEEITASLATAALQATGIAASLGNMIITVPVEGGTFGAAIVWDCVAWKSMLAFLALVFATDFPLRKKAWGMILLPVIFFINIARIWLMLFYVSTQGLAGYETLHAVVWSWGMVAAVLALWIAWMWWARKK